MILPKLIALVCLHCISQGQLITQYSSIGKIHLDCHEGRGCNLFRGKSSTLHISHISCTHIHIHLRISNNIFPFLYLKFQFKCHNLLWRKRWKKKTKSSVLSLEKLGSLRMFTFLFPYLNLSSLERWRSLVTNTLSLSFTLCIFEFSSRMIDCYISTRQNTGKPLWNRN